MPCYRCGARQSDPERGPSPWKRRVLREHLVLVCPACQRQPGWSAEFQSCARCGSLHLIRRLDQVECLECRLVREAAPDDVAPRHHASKDNRASKDDRASKDTGPEDTAEADGHAGDAALAAEVASALRRVLRRR
jgi:hypothetical protein